MKIILAAALLASISVNRMGDNISIPDAPDGAVLRTMGGDIDVHRARGSVVAKTMGGNIRVDEIDGSIDAGSMGGSIRVNVIGSGPDHNIELHSLGGEIELTLPRDFNGDVSVELEQGDDDFREHRIVSDFPLAFRESTRRRWFKTHKVIRATGKLGSAVNRVSITGVGDDIRIRAR